jgi:hypothetical protein
MLVALNLDNDLVLMPEKLLQPILSQDEIITTMDGLQPDLRTGEVFAVISAKASAAVVRSAGSNM